MSYHLVTTHEPKPLTYREGKKMSKKVKCWGNPFIRINLSTGKIDLEIPDEEIRKKFLLGRGLSDWFLFNSVDPGKTDPLSPENVLIFGGGMFEATELPGACRTNIVSLNVLTNGYGESSSAGSVGLELKKAGYDGIIVSGQSPSPMYLWIDDDHIELRDATNLTGKTTFETSDAIKEELQDDSIKTLTIGPAGEKLVRFANVNVQNRYSGRCGMGAIMGSKRFKAIAVRGTGSVELVDPEKFREISFKIRDLLKKDPITTFMAKQGMAATPEAYMEAGIDGIRNFQGAYWKGISDSGYEAVKKYYKKTLHCPTNCPVDCDRLVQIDEGDPYGGTWVNSMEATPAYNFAHFEVGDINTVIKGFELCNAYGVDMHSWSNVMQWAIECFERGILTREETDKLELRWQDGPLLLDSIQRIALRQGKFGNLLAEGVARASQKIGKGSEKYAMQMKGMEIDDDFRVCKGYGLGVLTELRGPAHTCGAWFGEFDPTFTPEIAKELYGTEHACDPHTWEDKADLVFLTERYAVIQDGLGVCLYATQRIGPQMIKDYNMKTYAELIKAAVGWDVTEEELFQIADRVFTLEKSINVLAGMTRKDDYPPDRFFEPLNDEKFKGWKLDRKDVDAALRRHDELHGWDAETGIPTPEILLKLDLKEVKDKLETAGLIG